MGQNGLGLLLVGAVLHSPLSAQDTSRVRRHVVPERTAATPGGTLKIPIRADGGHDSLLRDSTVRSTTRRAAGQAGFDKGADRRTRRSPMGLGIAQTLRIGTATRSSPPARRRSPTCSTRVPGVTTLLRVGWIAAPASAAYLGDVRRIRVFFDGIAWDPLDPRSPGVLDLSQINIWTLEESPTVEQAADEVRLYLRSWRTQSDHAVQREPDISTGDRNPDQSVPARISMESATIGGESICSSARSSIGTHAAE